VNILNERNQKSNQINLKLLFFQILHKQFLSYLCNSFRSIDIWSTFYCIKETRREQLCFNFFSCESFPIEIPVLVLKHFIVNLGLLLLYFIIPCIFIYSFFVIRIIISLVNSILIFFIILILIIFLIVLFDILLISFLCRIL